MYRKSTAVNTTWCVLSGYVYLFSYGVFGIERIRQVRGLGSGTRAGNGVVDFGGIRAIGTGCDGGQARNTKRPLFSRRSANPRFSFPVRVEMVTGSGPGGGSECPGWRKRSRRPESWRVR